MRDEETKKRGGILELCLKIRINLFQARLCGAMDRVWSMAFVLFLLPLPGASASCWSLAVLEVIDVSRKVSSEKRGSVVSRIMKYLEG